MTTLWRSSEIQRDFLMEWATAQAEGRPPLFPSEEDIKARVDWHGFPGDQGGMPVGGGELEDEGDPDMPRDVLDDMIWP